MALKRSLLLNTFASVGGKASSLVTRIASVPIYLYFFGTVEYGNWIVLSSLLSWLSIANLGLGSVGANEMSMAMAQGDHVKARTVLSSALYMLVWLLIFSTPAVFCLAYFIPWSSILVMDEKRSFELLNAVLYLALAVGISFIGGIFSSRLVAGGKAHLAMHTASVRPWFDLAASTVALYLSCRFDILAFALMASVLGHTLLVRLISLSYVPSLTFSKALVDRAISKQLLSLGLAFQAFPIGNAMIFQGFVMVVQSILGPSAVVLFSTARTLVRSVNQAMEFVNQVVWPEMTRLIGSNDFRRAAELHRISVTCSFLVALFMTIGIGLFGKSLFALWTGGQLVLTHGLLWLFLLAIPVNSLWFTSSVVHAACNMHQELALRYLGATIFSLLCCIPLTYFFGLGGTAIATAVVDVLLVRFVISKSLEITHESYAEFVSGVWSSMHSIPLAAKIWLQIGRNAS